MTAHEVAELWSRAIADAYERPEDGCEVLQFAALILDRVGSSEGAALRAAARQVLEALKK